MYYTFWSIRSQCPTFSQVNIELNQKWRYWSSSAVLLSKLDFTSMIFKFQHIISLRWWSWPWPNRYFWIKLVSQSIEESPVMLAKLSSESELVCKFSRVSCCVDGLDCPATIEARESRALCWARYDLRGRWRCAGACMHAAQPNNRI